MEPGEEKLGKGQLPESPVPRSGCRVQIGVKPYGGQPGDDRVHFVEQPVVVRAGVANQVQRLHPAPQLRRPESTFTRDLVLHVPWSETVQVGQPAPVE